MKLIFNDYDQISLILCSLQSWSVWCPTYNLSLSLNRTFINKYQFGSRDEHSTFMALIIITENCVNAIDTGKSSAGIFLDFQKAFDTVDDCIRQDEIQLYVIRDDAFDWFCLYFHYRKQLVNYWYESYLKIIVIWVPRRFIFRPLLY